MKIRLTKQYTIPWEEIDIEQTNLRYEDITKEIYDLETKPLDIRNVRMGKNDRGQLVLIFDSKNHKYFEIWPNMGSKSWDDNPTDDGESEFGSKDIHICSDVEVIEKSEDDYKPSRNLWSCDIVISPESKEEEELLGYKVASQPLKWEYALTFMTYDDFGFDKRLEGSFDEDEQMKEDMIYFFETNKTS